MRYKKNNRGSYILTDKNGNEFTVTKKEYDEINKLTKRANQRRTDRTHMYYDVLAESEGMRGIDFDAYQQLLEDHHFITEKYTSSLAQFNSKKDVTEHLKTLRAVTQKGYGLNAIDDVRYSMIDRVSENFGSQGEALIERIKHMSRAEILKIYLTSDSDIIRTIYGSPVLDDMDDFVEQTSAYFDKMLSGSLAKKLSDGEYKKGRINYQARQRYAKAKRERKQKSKI